MHQPTSTKLISYSYKISNVANDTYLKFQENSCQLLITIVIKTWPIMLNSYLYAFEQLVLKEVAYNAQYMAVHNYYTTIICQVKLALA